MMNTCRYSEVYLPEFGLNTQTSTTGSSCREFEETKPFEMPINPDLSSLNRAYTRRTCTYHGYGGPEVFLGGSCQPTTWRKDEAIPHFSQLGITYFDPLADDWRPEMVEIEEAAKQSCSVALFAFDFSKTSSLASLAEAAYFIGTSAKVVLMCIQGPPHLPSPSNAASNTGLSLAWSRVLQLAEYTGISVFTTWTEASTHSKAIIDETRNERLLHSTTQGEADDRTGDISLSFIQAFLALLEQLSSPTQSLSIPKVKRLMREIQLGPIWPTAIDLQEGRLTDRQFIATCSSYLGRTGCQPGQEPLWQLDDDKIELFNHLDIPWLLNSNVVHFSPSTESVSAPNEHRRSYGHPIIHIGGLNESSIHKVALDHLALDIELVPINRLDNTMPSNIYEWIKCLCCVPRQKIVYVIPCGSPSCIPIIVEVAYILGTGLPIVLCILDSCDLYPEKEQPNKTTASGEIEFNRIDVNKQTPLARSLSPRLNRHMNTTSDDSSSSNNTIHRGLTFISNEANDSGISSSNEMSPTDGVAQFCGNPVTSNSFFNGDTRRNTVDVAVLNPSYMTHEANLEASSPPGKQFDQMNREAGEENSKHFYVDDNTVTSQQPPPSYASDRKLFDQGVNRAITYLLSMAERSNIPVVHNLDDAILRCLSSEAPFAPS